LVPTSATVRQLHEDPLRCHVRVMSKVHVILVEPRYEGNVGTVARVMKNFEVTDLRLVRPCALGEEARRRAMHGSDVLRGAAKHESLASAIEGLHPLVGTSGVDTANAKKFLRIAITPRELAARLAQVDTEVGLVFGREDLGLRNDELKACDLLVTIPANPNYAILNIGHAAAILLYEIYGTMAKSKPSRKPRKASAFEKGKLLDAFESLLEVTDYPLEKRERTQVMFRRLMGRAVPSKWEFHALMGVLQRATKRIGRLEAKR